MRRVLGALLLLALVPAVPAWAGGGEPAFARRYDLSVPEHPQGSLRPLVVYLHGCTQTAADAARGTRWSDLGASEGVYVLYPEQSSAANGSQCWNWFLPEHQARGSGEPAILAGIVAHVVATNPIDPSRVYVSGASAGADMATILAVTYPDVFAAVAPLAGCAYATCADVTGSLAREAMGERYRPVPAMVVQGTLDPLNNAAAGETAVRQWIGTNDASPVPTSTEHDPGQTDPAPGSGDPCIRNKQFPCAGGALGWGAYPATVNHHVAAGDPQAACSLVDAWYVHGLSHDYPGGDPQGSFTDPIGPDITAAAWAFFRQHRLGAPCGG